MNGLLTIAIPDPLCLNLAHELDIVNTRKCSDYLSTGAIEVNTLHIFENAWNIALEILVRILVVPKKGLCRQ